MKSNYNATNATFGISYNMNTNIFIDTYRAKLEDMDKLTTTKQFISFGLNDRYRNIILNGAFT